MSLLVVCISIHIQIVCISEHNNSLSFHKPLAMKPTMKFHNRKHNIKGSREQQNKKKTTEIIFNTIKQPERVQGENEANKKLNASQPSDKN